MKELRLDDSGKVSIIRQMSGCPFYAVLDLFTLEDGSFSLISGEKEQFYHLESGSVVETHMKLIPNLDEPTQIVEVLLIEQGLVRTKAIMDHIVGTLGCEPSEIELSLNEQRVAFSLGGSFHLEQLQDH
jgi:hypothetical protein